MVKRPSGVSVEVLVACVVSFVLSAAMTSVFWNLHMFTNVSSPPLPMHSTVSATTTTTTATTATTAPKSETGTTAAVTLSTSAPPPPPSKVEHHDEAALDDLESAKSHKKDVRKRKFVYTILTSQEHHNTRIKAVMETWGRHVDIAFIASDAEEKRLPLIKNLQVKGKDKLGEKAMMVLAKMCDQDADFYVMTDDDTFVIAHNLEYLFSSTYKPEEDVYAGYSLKHMKPEIIGGGGGIVFSKGTMKKFCAVAEDAKHSCSYKHGQTSAGDAAIVYCMQALGIGATHQTGFNPFPITQMIDQPKNWCTETWWFPKHIKCPPVGGAATFHYVPFNEYNAYYWWSYTFSPLAPSSPRRDSPYLPG